MAVDKVTVNGNLFDSGSVTVLVNGNPLNGWSSIKYSDKRERSYGYGAGKSHAPRGRTRGKYSAAASISMFKDSAEAFRALLAQDAGGSYGNARFTLGVQYYEPGETLINVQIIDCTIAGDDSEDKESPDPLTEDFDLMPMYITRNGRTLFDATGGGVAGAIVGAVKALAGVIGL